MFKLLLIGGLSYLFFRMTTKRVEAPRGDVKRETEIGYTEYEEVEE